MVHLFLKLFHYLIDPESVLLIPFALKNSLDWPNLQFFFLIAVCFSHQSFSKFPFAYRFQVLITASCTFHSPISTIRAFLFIAESEILKF